MKACFRESAVDLARQLLRIESPTGKEKRITFFLEDCLKKMGFETRLQEVAENRWNLIARRGDPRVVFSTHLDTVLPLLPVREDRTFLYGRGACDTKGIIAAQVKAAEYLLNCKKNNFGLLFVVGEEAESPGARAANLLPNRCRFLINGEPTDNCLAVGSKGTLRIKLCFRGKACHSAYPEMGHSAIESMLDVLHEIRGLEFPEDKLLGKTTLNIGLINGGVQPNVLAPSASCVLMYRVGCSMEQIRRVLQERFGHRCEMDFYFSYPPVKTLTLAGYQTMVASFGTDIPFLFNWGQPLLIGPGSILDAHSAEEKISKEQIRDAVSIYADLGVALLEKAEEPRIRSS